MSTLYIVATPIGNLKDISERAAEVLESVSYIACEDTRTSGVLLNHLGINTPTFAFHQHNEHQKVNHLINILDARQQVALISDAGMPGISDPGFLAVRAAHQAGHSVSVIPGPDAATTALVASGLPCDKYVFEGFLPPRKGRQKQLKRLIEEERSVVLYESPHRLIKLLTELRNYMGDQRMIAVCRELTKKFEEIIRGSVKSVYDRFELRDEIKGEIVVVIAPKDYSE
ncbi:16S rRNA (cytidine(1402)-2'-O)-methyltransferase [Fodinibius sediminis]|uniref:Ribosomal RNA small subunit methyltransferase I n=1 Tax=Fodinibius sediminis TaxID=1214077 RepID=A0A521BU74_9BACT|nr:16S rRNA (cytidine(1402)-2'-O)-methyltransferase [Fodinibius sediminis]SMO50706.1 16S rRNA (cytidine1402-2'-O)-methyltransferase [Fodinibius sediminis]